MGINATLETLSLSGKKAKRRTINCQNRNNLLNCYFGIINNNTITAIISKRDIILQAIKKIQDTEALIEIELAKQSEANFGFVDAELLMNFYKIKEFKLLLMNKTIDTYELSNNFLEEINNGIQSDVAVLKVFSEATKGSYGVQILTALLTATRPGNDANILPPDDYVPILPPILPPDNLDNPDNPDNPEPI